MLTEARVLCCIINFFLHLAHWLLCYEYTLIVARSRVKETVKSHCFPRQMKTWRKGHFKPRQTIPYQTCFPIGSLPLFFFFSFFFSNPALAEREIAGNAIFVAKDRPRTLFPRAHGVQLYPHEHVRVHALVGGKQRGTKSQAISIRRWAHTSAADELQSERETFLNLSRAWFTALVRSLRRRVVCPFLYAARARDNFSNPVKKKKEKKKKQKTERGTNVLYYRVKNTPSGIKTLSFSGCNSRFLVCFHLNEHTIFLQL